MGTGKLFLLLAKGSVGEGGGSSRIDCWGTCCCCLKCDGVVSKVKHYSVQDSPLSRVINLQKGNHLVTSHMKL